jgi:hypothetical protein
LGLLPLVTPTPQRDKHTANTDENMMHANINANINNHILIINAINKAIKATNTLPYRALGVTRLGKMDQQEVNFSFSPAESPAVALREKPAGERNNRAATVRYLSQRRERKRSK